MIEIKNNEIFIIDDEVSVRDFLKVLLSSHGFKEIREASCGKMALDEISKKRPSLVILDLGLPDLDGLIVLEEIRKKMDIPVLILSVRNQEDDKIKAFDLGADDYLTKPFGPRELLARIKLLLQKKTRRKENPKTLVNIGDLEIDLTKRAVFLKGTPIRLTDIEYKLLVCMVKEPGKLFTHREILKEVWGGNYTEHVEYLRVYIGHLRQKIELDPAQPKVIITEPGIGYRLTGEPI